MKKLFTGIVLFLCLIGCGGGGSTENAQGQSNQSTSGYSETIVQSGNYGGTGEYIVETFENAEIAQIQANENNISNVIEASGNLLILDISCFPLSWGAGEIILVRMPNGIVEYKRLLLKFTLSSGQLAIGVEPTNALEAISSMELTTTGTVTKSKGYRTKKSKSVDYDYSTSQLITLIDKKDVNIFYVKDENTEVTVGFPKIKLSVNPQLTINMKIDKPLGLSNIIGKATDLATKVFSTTGEVLDSLGLNGLGNNIGDEVVNIDSDKAKHVLEMVRASQNVVEALESIQTVLLDPNRLKLAQISLSGNITGALEFAAISSSQYGKSQEISLGTILVPITGPVPIFLEFEVVAVASFNFESQLSIKTGATLDLPILIKAKVVDGQLQPLETSSFSPEIDFTTPGFDGTKAGLSLSAGIQVETGLTIASILSGSIDPTVSMVFETAAEVNGDIVAGCLDLDWDLYANISAQLEAELDIIINKWTKQWDLPISIDFFKEAEPRDNYSYCWGDDADNDGVSDDSDTCPNTPEGSTVDESGCVDTNVRTRIADVVFGDEDLKDYILSTGAINTDEVTVLVYSEEGLTSLIGLEEFYGLTTLFLDVDDISDLSPLKGLTGLTDLYLGGRGNGISDLSPLKGLTGLTDLTLYYNNINDVSPLMWMSALTYLDLSHNNISDISALQNLSELKSLCLDSNEITDISLFQNMTGLERLSLKSNKITDISNINAFHNMPGLKQLNLKSNNISEICDINALQNLTGLNIVTLESNRINDISGVKNLRLGTLLLGDNNISNISSLESQTGLIWLGLESNRISDISPLKNLTGLAGVTLNDNNIICSDINTLRASLPNTIIEECSAVSIIPQNVIAVAGDEMITVSWDTVSGASQYVVFISETSGEFSNLSAASINGEFSTSYTIGSRINGTRYYFVVQSIVSGVESEYSYEVSEVPVATTPPIGESDYYESFADNDTVENAQALGKVNLQNGAGSSSSFRVIGYADDVDVVSGEVFGGEDYYSFVAPKTGTVRMSPLAGMVGVLMNSNGEILYDQLSNQYSNFNLTEDATYTIYINNYNYQEWALGLVPGSQYDVLICYY